MVDSLADRRSFELRRSHSFSGNRAMLRQSEVSGSKIPASKASAKDLTKTVNGKLKLHTLKPEPLFVQPVRPVCPVCGVASYSRDGIHPQCASRQADAPRSAQLRLLRIAEKKKPAPLKQRTWEKDCPNCKTRVHVRNVRCKCGHSFKSY
jgi:hypothetical protein